MPKKAPLILASSSPRRLQLLRTAGIDCAVVRPADVDETPLPGEAPEPMVCRLALAKAASITSPDPRQWVLGSDTTVTIEVENGVRLRIEKSAVAMDNTQTIDATKNQ